MWSYCRLQRKKKGAVQRKPYLTNQYRASNNFGAPIWLPYCRTPRLNQQKPQFRERLKSRDQYPASSSYGAPIWLSYIGVNRGRTKAAVPRETEIDRPMSRLQQLWSADMVVVYCRKREDEQAAVPEKTETDRPMSRLQQFWSADTAVGWLHERRRRKASVPRKPECDKPISRLQTLSSSPGAAIWLSYSAARRRQRKLEFRKSRI